MIQVTDVWKSFLDGERQVEVLKGAQLSVAAGESIALMGPSGSGKSTLLNLLAGLMSADRGTVCLSVRDQQWRLETMGPKALARMRRRAIGYVHQFFNLIPTLTVLENVQLPAYLSGMLDRDHRQRAQALLQSFQVADKAHTFPEKLSGGEQQRVAVARALLMHPPLILADEPTGNLDNDNAANVATLLYASAKEHGASLIVATHSQVIAQMADVEVRLHQGQTMRVE